MNRNPNLFSRLQNCRFLPNRYRVRIAFDTLAERIRGIDFTMPDRMYDRNRNDGAMYYRTPEKILRHLFSLVDTTKFNSFVDIGCGKGYVLWQAYEYGFDKVTGIEYDEKLCQIGNRNLKRLELHRRINIACCDACTFEDYSQYNVFYLFNPFGKEIMDVVIDRIIQHSRGKEIMIIYYRPRYPEAIENSGYFTKRHILYDLEKDYEANVYHGHIPE